MPITDESYPVRCLIHILQDAGWHPVARSVVHVEQLRDGSHLPYDGREHPAQRHYFQALVNLQTTLPLAHGRLPSNEYVAFYKLLLRGIKTQPGLTNREYVLAWNQAKGTTNKTMLALPDRDDRVPPPSGTHAVFFAPLAEGPAPKPKPRAAAFGRGGGGKGGGRGGKGGDVAPLPPPVVEPPVVYVEPPIEDVPPPGGGGGGDVPPEGAASSSGGGGGDLASGFFAPPLGEDSVQGPLVDSLHGIKVQYNNYMNKKTGKAEPHWVLHCQSCGARGCSKRRGALPVFEKEYGEAEPLAFLHAWHDIPWATNPTKPTHAAEWPSKQAVRELAVAHEEFFKKVCREAGR